MSDKRTVHTDALDTLGTLSLEETASRDAIHIAVEPVLSDEILYAGQFIGIENGKASTKAKKLLGIVDPFLTGAIYPGNKFWMLVFPRTITSLRHVWSHPDFNEELKIPSFPQGVSGAKSWLQNWCKSTGDITYEELIEVMDKGFVKSENPENGYELRWENHHDYLLSVGCDNSTYDIPAEVWIHVETILGRKLDSYPSHFSCSC